MPDPQQDSERPGSDRKYTDRSPPPFPPASSTPGIRLLPVCRSAADHRSTREKPSERKIGIKIFPKKFARFRFFLIFALRSGERKPGQPTSHAQVVELVDTLVSGTSASDSVQVRVLSWAPTTGPLNSSGPVYFFLMRKRPCAVAAALQSVVAPNTNPSTCMQPIGRTPRPTSLPSPPFSPRPAASGKMLSYVALFPFDIALYTNYLPVPNDRIRQNRVINRIKSDSFFAYTEGKCVFLRQEKRRYNTQIKTQHIYAQP